MGRGRKGHGKGFGGLKGKKNRQASRDDENQKGYDSVTVLENADFEEYYKALGIVPEEEWSDFMAALRRPLAATFRIHKGELMEYIRERMQNHFSPLVSSATLEDGSKGRLEPLPWYPNECGWYTDASRKDIRKSPELKEFHKFLVAFSERGFLSRQETVSMVPSFFLDVCPGHHVLDTCAAPGNKTVQILEDLRSSDGTLKDSLCVANDVDQTRCFMLCRQTLARVAAPGAVVVNYDARLLQQVRTGNKEKVLFDRILCDVVCSGDGTFRKNLDMWLKWNVQFGRGLHQLQKSIATQATKLLKVGGRMVYSTCSLNPLEDEAVVSSLLRQSQGSLQLVDCTGKLPALKRRAGISHWRVRGKNAWLDSYAACEGTDETTIHASMFPPSTEEAALFHLERCMRFLPHDQDTGGFFVAVLELVQELPLPDKVHAVPDAKAECEVEIVEPASKKVKTDTQEDQKEEEMGKRNEETPKLSARDKARGSVCEPYYPLDTGLDYWKQVSEFYGIKDTLPTHCLMVHESNHPYPRRVTLLSETAAKMVETSAHNKLKLINAGLKVFVRNQRASETVFRIPQDAVRTMVPHLSKQVIRIGREDLRALLLERDLFEGQRSSYLNETLLSIRSGCCIAVVAEAGDPYQLVREQPDITLVALWYGKAVVNLMLSNQERYAFQEMYLTPLEVQALEVKEKEKNVDQAQKDQPADAEE